MMTVNAGASLGQEVGGRSDGRPRGRRVRVRPQPAVPSLRAEIISHSQTGLSLQGEMSALLCFTLRKNTTEEHDLRP